MNSVLGGLDEEVKEESTATNERVVIDLEAEKKKRKPFHFWKVGSEEFKLKLRTAQISKLENKYKCNIITLVEDIPPLDVMLTIVQAAMMEWTHGVKFEKVQRLFDQYVEEGGSQIDFYTKIILPTMVVSGFFTQKMADSVMEAMEEL